MAEAGAPGNSSSQPCGSPFTIRLMPMPSIMPPTSDPMTPAETPSQMISARVIMAEWYGGMRARTSTGWLVSDPVQKETQRDRAGDCDHARTQPARVKPHRHARPDIATDRSGEQHRQCLRPDHRAGGDEIQHRHAVHCADQHCLGRVHLLQVAGAVVWPQTLAMLF